MALWAKREIEKLWDLTSYGNCDDAVMCLFGSVGNMSQLENEMDFFFVRWKQVSAP